MSSAPVFENLRAHHLQPGEESTYTSMLLYSTFLCCFSSFLYQVCFGIEDELTWKYGSNEDVCRKMMFSNCSIKNCILKYLLHLFCFVYACGYMCDWMSVHATRHIWKSEWGSCLTWYFWGLNSGHQASLPMPLPTDHLFDPLFT